MRRGDFFLAFAHENQIDGQLFPAGLEREEGAQKRILRPLLVDGAAAHADGPQPFLIDEAAFQRRRTPFSGHELLHVVHEVDRKRRGRARVERAENAGLAGGGYEFDAGESGGLGQFRHVLRPLRIVAVLGGDRRQRNPVLQPLDVLRMHLRNLREHGCLVRAFAEAAPKAATGAAASTAPDTAP